MPEFDQSRDVRSLGDFTATGRLILISVLAVLIGGLTAGVAAALLHLIDFGTNLFFFHRLSFEPVSPANHELGPVVVLVPIAGALIVGLMARFGSERIRGHGIPEAIESILVNGSRVDPKVALLKPVSAAVSIGSGGPFGAEGPIIMTGGACGSLLAQCIHLTSAERKTLLVAGAAAGMSATFAAPLASVLLAVELLLFELKPRSAIPVAMAAAVAAIVRPFLLGAGPIFPVAPHVLPMTPLVFLACVPAGLGAGLLSMVLTEAVYLAEDFFQALPMHWMWWPAMGGLVIGAGGWLFPQALGVGYDVIGDFLNHREPLTVIAGVLLVKSVMWAVSLGSGTSGGVLAPLLMMGAALGGLEAEVLPEMGTGFWPLISMAAILGGAMRVPLTGIVFAMELTHDFDVALPLILAVMVAYGVTVLCQRRSILTEKISRRGLHLSREYAVDPLEIVFAREVMRTAVVALPADSTLDAARLAAGRGARASQRLFPVIDQSGRLVGVVTGTQVRGWTAEGGQDGKNGKAGALGDLLGRPPVVAHEDEPLRLVVSRMARTGLTRLPVVDRDGRLVGMVGLSDLLRARARGLEAEHRRERVLGLRLRIPAVFNRRA